MSNETYHIAAFYRFVELADFEAIKEPLLAFCKAHDMKGTILLASEGINSTISATEANMKAFFAYLDQDERLANMPHKLHTAAFQPFEKMKVRLKKEIVRLAYDKLDMAQIGDYVKPEKWDDLISDPDVIVIDTRNEYEVGLGTFEGAVNPHTQEFRALPEWVDQHLDPQKHKKVAMFCTGGIRCEKSTALLKQKGFEEVYHLEGGILQYLKDTGNKSGKWQGDCFVFDDRIAVNDQLEPSSDYACSVCGSHVLMDEIRWLSKGDRIICRRCSNDEAAKAKLQNLA